MVNSDKKALWFVGVLVIATVAVIQLMAVASPLRGSLFDGSLVTGWGLIVLLVALCACTWSPRRSIGALSAQLRWVALLTAVSAVTFTGHIQAFPPTGILDRSLALIFATLLSSSTWGLWISMRLKHRASSRDRKTFRLWLYLQAMLLGLLVGAGFVHGVLIHTHGMVAKALAG